MTESLTEWNRSEAMQLRYKTIIGNEVDGLGLNRDEWMFLCDILNGTLLDMFGWHLLHHEVADADQSYAERWGVDRAGLATKLGMMTLAQRAAVSEVVVRWWEAAGGRKYHTHDALLETALRGTREQGVINNRSDTQ